MLNRRGCVSENIRKRIANISFEFDVLSKSETRIFTKEIDTFQKEFASATYQLSKAQFPSDVQFYADTDHANEMLKHLEKAMDLDKLSIALKVDSQEAS